jgi:hypothetical protein
LLEGPLQLQQLELTYTNWFPDDEMAQSTVLKQAIAASDVQILGAETRYDPTIALNHYFLTQNGVPAGRLSVNTMGGSIRSAGVSVQRGSFMNVSYFADLEPGISDARLTEAIAFGRNAIVYAFDQLTTGPAHALWERE